LFEKKRLEVVFYSDTASYNLAHYLVFLVCSGDT